MAEKKISKAEKMYANSPSLQRDTNDGKMKATRENEGKKKADEVQGGTEGAERPAGKEGDTEGADQAIAAHVRHANERQEMHARHEHEHRMHDEGEHGSKKEMHSRHEKEQRAMNTKHEKEADGEGMIDKVEENKKEEE